MTAVGFITFISVLSRLLGLLKKCIIIIHILCIDWNLENECSPNTVAQKEVDFRNFWCSDL